MSSRIDFFYYAFRNILLVSVPVLLISALVLSLPHSSAVSSDSSGTDNVQLVLSTSCTVNAVVTSEHTVSLNGGQLDNNVGNTKLSAYCNDNNGYGIYAIGSSGDIDGNTDLINTVSESYNIRTGVYDSNNTVNPSSWAMKLTAGTGTGIDPVTGESVPTTPPTIVNGYGSYSAIPNVYTLVAKRVSGTSMATDTSISGSYLNTTYQIYANSAQPSGTYNGKVKYVMVHPNRNSQNTINGSFNVAFIKAGKNPAYQDDDGNYYFAMQDMTTDICNSIIETGEATATQLVDRRDNKLYWVAKLADGHCWMTQNLDLDLAMAYTDVQGQKIIKSLTSEDTDLTDHSLTGAYADGYSYDSTTGITSWTPVSTTKTINFEGTTVTGWQDSYTKPYSASKTDTTNTGHTSLGNYYNWTAAIASNDSSALTSDTIYNISLNPQNSICPKGWRLPTVSGQSGATTGSTNEFARLNYLYKNMLDEPLYFIRSGYTALSSIYLLDSEGIYSSSTVYNTSSVYGAALKTGATNFKLDWWSSGYGGRLGGWTIRCLAR